MPNKTKLLSVVGARPQFVKLGPIARAADGNSSIEHRVVHTGQHYDANMSGTIFGELDLPTPDVNLGVGSGSHGEQTAAMIEGLENTLLTDRPDLVLTYGDTNSTLAATLAASKIHVPVAHIEAGLRSFNRLMPEEINRLVADHCSDRLYAPTPQSMRNLEKEDLQDRALLTGDIMLDAVLQNIEAAEEKSSVMDDFGLQAGSFGLVTIHRPVNTSGQALKRLLDALETIASSHLPLVFPLHPRTRSVLDELGYKAPARLTLLDPLSYLDIIVLIRAARIVMTDSGGIQKESAFLQTLCLTLRDETEWTETVDIGVNRLVGDAGTGLVGAVDDVLGAADAFNDEAVRRVREHFGDGHAASRIIDDCARWLG